MSYVIIYNYYNCAYLKSYINIYNEFINGPNYCNDKRFRASFFFIINYKYYLTIRLYSYSKIFSMFSN